MGRRPIRILLIEDDETDYLATRKMLSAVENQPYDVHWANSVDSGLEAIRRRSHDVCLLDFTKDNTAGLELLKESRDTGCIAPVILMGGVGNREFDIESIAPGASDFLVKGKITPELLERSIRYSIARAQTTYEVQRQQEELRASELRFRSVFQSVADAIILADDNAKIVAWNKGAEEIFGYSEEEILGSRLEVLMPESYRDAHRADFERFLVTGRSEIIGKTRKLEGLRKTGGVFPIELSLASWRSGAGTMFTGIVRDITGLERTEDLRRAREAADKANRAKSSFVASMSHELRTGLHAIIGFTNLLLQEKSGNLAAQDRDFLQRILLNARDQLHLINSVLDLSRIEAGRMELQLEEIGIEALLADVIKQIKGEERNPHVDLILRVPSASTPMRADAARLKQVLMNLIDNALKYTPSGTVTVELAVDAVDLQPNRIDVTDTGVGIPQARIGEIFEPFHQLESSPGRLEGSGLGLSICRSLCHLMGYRLEVRSCPGSGSTFSIILKSDAHRLPRCA
jgi:protein-histidine pros-kinase